MSNQLNKKSVAPNYAFLAIMLGSMIIGSTLLKNVTSDYHYHTICADSEDILDAIEKELKNYGFLVSPKS